MKLKRLFISFLILAVFLVPFQAFAEDPAPVSAAPVAGVPVALGAAQAALTAAQAAPPAVQGAPPVPEAAQPQGLGSAASAGLLLESFRPAVVAVVVAAAGPPVLQPGGCDAAQ